MSENKFPNLKVTPRMQPPQFDITEAIPKVCEHCGGLVFNKVFRMGLISALAPKNQLRRDIPVEYPTYICCACGVELFAKPSQPQDEKNDKG
jgi:hypothetical protein